MHAACVPLSILPLYQLCISLQLWRRFTANRSNFLEERTLLTPQLEWNVCSACKIQNSKFDNKPTNFSVAVRKSLLFLLFGVLLDGAGLVSGVICAIRQNPYKSLLAAALTHIFAGKHEAWIQWRGSNRPTLHNRRTLYQLSQLDIAYFVLQSKLLHNKQQECDKSIDPKLNWWWGQNRLSLHTKQLFYLLRYSGIANFLCIIVYMANVSKEIGNKLYPETRMDDPLFHYEYGYSFISLKVQIGWCLVRQPFSSIVAGSIPVDGRWSFWFKVSFLCCELAAVLALMVYMAKRDERTYNR